MKSLALLGSVLALAFTAAPAGASISDGTSNTIMVAGPKKPLAFQGGCSRGSDTCLMEEEGIFWTAQ
jgi:hypothetical protein